MNTTAAGGTEPGAQQPAPVDGEPAPSTLSARLRAATRTDHAEAEEHGLMRALLGGTLPREGYAALVAQHYVVYVALEEVGRALSDDPVAGAVVLPELFRVPALERDLTTLYGTDWRTRIAPTPATRTYVARIHQMADDPCGYLAHHYTRYLGDLSGGQVIRATAVRVYGFPDGRGTEFYDFDQVESLPRFKAEYRRRLDALDLDGPARRRTVRETRLAYQLNVEVLADLGRDFLSGMAA